MRTRFPLALAAAALLAAPASAAVQVVTDPHASPRELYGVSRLRAAVEPLSGTGRIVAATRASTVFAEFGEMPPFATGSSEGFHLRRAGDTILVIGNEPSGVLYGSLELARRIHEEGRLPAALDVTDQPAFVLRGTNIGMQKTEVTYDGAIYDYRYTPEDFPFFYDQPRWLRYLDFLAENRMNTLYLWNGHPFTSLLKLPKYPEARELSDDQLDRNIAMFKWLTGEADKRGIWVVQGFYNIHLSHAFAKAHGVPLHLSAPTPLASEYTRYCVSEFIRNYPNAGILMTLGEALAPAYGPEWLTKTIIPGVKDGMKALGITKEPPIVVRAHATDIEHAMKQALPLYKNIYTMHKYNGESLTWTDVRGDIRKLHEKLVGLGSMHIVNVHLLSNLEPFRWGSPEFIQQVMLSCQRMGVKGLHLYPLRYWEWPVSADNPPLDQIERDWIWFEAWARYAWNPARPPAAEREYWIGRIATKYGTREAAARILDAYQHSGVCAPRLLPSVGITEGNRQSLTLGMLMTQLIDPERYNQLPLLWNAQAPPGERLDEWVKREWEHQPHEGETPIRVVREVVDSAERAVAAAEAAGPGVTRNRDEYLRLLNDTRAITALMRYYAAKTRAAALVLRYSYSRDADDLDRALPLLRESVTEFRRLVALTDTSYREACSIHSASRRIPFLGAPGRYTHWRDTLPEYEKELARFESNLKIVHNSGTVAAVEKPRAPLPAVAVKLASPNAELFTVQPGAKIYTDRSFTIDQVTPDLRNLTGIRIPDEKASKGGVHLEFELAEPAQILVGFFRSSKKGAAAAPPRDEWSPVLRNALAAGAHPGFTVWSHALPGGKNDLDLGPGAYVVLGFVKKDAPLEPRMVFFPGAAQSRPDLDWLFE